MRLESILRITPIDKEAEVSAIYGYLQEVSDDYSKANLGKISDLKRRIQGYDSELFACMATALATLTQEIGMSNAFTKFVMHLRAFLTMSSTNKTLERQYSAATSSDSAVFVYAVACTLNLYGDRVRSEQLCLRLLECTDTSLEINAINLLYRFSSDSFGNPNLRKLVTARKYDLREYCFEMNLLGITMGDRDIVTVTSQHMKSAGIAPLSLIVQPYSGKLMNFGSRFTEWRHGIKRQKSSTSIALQRRT